MPITTSDGRIHYSFHEAPPTPETLAYHAAQVTWWKARHPSMFIAPQPEPLPQKNGSHRMNMKDEWPAIAAAFNCREPVSPYETLIPITAVGWCLSGIIEHGDRYWLDTRLVPQAGDIVVVAQPPEVCEKFNSYGDTIPGFRECYGAQTSPIMAKLLRPLGSDWFLCTNTAAFPLDDARVLGVVVRIERGAGGGVAGAAALADDDESAEAHCAAQPELDLHQATAAGLTRIEVIAPATSDTKQVAWTEITFEHTTEFQITASFTLGVSTGSATYTVRVGTMYGNTAGTSMTFVGQYQTKTTLANERFTVIGLIPAGTFSTGSHTRRLGLGVDILSVDGVNNLQADFLDVTIAVTAKYY